jgi:hypothetical protein
MSHSTQRTVIEEAALQHCAKLLTTAAAQAIPREHAEGLLILAFTYGAAWALDRRDMIELGDAQLDALRSAQQ